MKYGVWYLAQGMFSTGLIMSVMHTLDCLLHVLRIEALVTGQGSYVVVISVVADDAWSVRWCCNLQWHTSIVPAQVVVQQGHLQNPCKTVACWKIDKHCGNQH